MSHSSLNPRADYSGLVIQYLKKRVNAKKYFGLLEAHGPTGMGKTHAFVARHGVIEFLLDHNIPVIFCSDRWALLDEVENKIPDNRAVVVKKNQTAVKEACDYYLDAIKTRSEEIERFAEAFIFHGQPERIEQKLREEGFADKDTGKSLVKYLNHMVDKAKKEIKKNENEMNGDDDSDDRFFSSDTYKLIHFLSFNRGRDIEIKNIENAIMDLASHPFYLKMFPACAWFIAPTRKILVTTTQKLVHGFYIGPIHLDAMTLPKLEKTYQWNPTAIILDEFEAQEEAMLSALANQTNMIANPFEFQKVVYDGASDWASRGDEEQGELLKMAKKVVKKFKPLPARLVVGDGWNDVSTEYTFRSGNVIYRSTSLVGVIEKKRIVIHRAQNYRAYGPKAKPFARIIGRANRINRYCLEGSAHFHDINHNYALSYFMNLFDGPGGSQTKHGKIFNNPTRALLFHGAKRGLMDIRPEEKMSVTESHLLGYDLVGLIQRPTGGALPVSDLDVRHYAMPITPEGLLARWATERFVFALSATTCLHRVCNHFDMGWVNHFLAKRDALIADDAAFRESVGEIVAKETAHAHCHFEMIPKEEALEGLRDIGDYLSKKKHSRKRLFEIWRVIAMLSNRVSPSPYTCLTFTISFRHIKEMLTEDNEKATRAKTAIFQALDIYLSEIHLKEEQKEEQKDQNKQSIAYQLNFEDPNKKSVLLFFLNAEAYRLEKDFQKFLNDLKNKARDLGSNLMILTAYASSERGVNLLFYDDIAMDTVCMIEPPYHYISSEASDTRKNLRRMQKITEKGIMRPYVQEVAIKDMLFGGDPSAYERAIKKFQTNHKNTSDHKIAGFASFVQAAGRGVRNWQSVKEKTFYVSEELGISPLKSLANDLRIESCLFLLGPIGQGLYRCIQEKSSADAPRIRKMQRDDQALEQSLQCLTDRLEDFRNGAPESEIYRDYWERIRRAVLLGHVKETIPTHMIGMHSKKDSQDITLLDFGYEPCDPTWEDATTFGQFIRAIQNADDTNDTKEENNPLNGLKHYFRIEGTICPLEIDGVFYKPRTKITQSIIKPSVSERVVLEFLRKHGAISYHEDRRLYELFDLFVPKMNLAIDVKYWSDRFILEAEDNGYADKAKARLLSIRKVLGDDAKLLYVFFLDSLDDDRFRDVHAFQDRLSKDGFASIAMFNQHDFSLTNEFIAFQEWLDKMDQSSVQSIQSSDPSTKEVC